ncbi:MAG TPA: SusC/RagA family TonB-linked outer membrane protein [Porphyromonadaceae bacterium]|jgi:TonB-linked SusC/RagA family outer membrane protein|nr:SusC/RagA family TonB-linked outer membrane protein [Porphyromonadaceae bacterium]
MKSKKSSLFKGGIFLCMWALSLCLFAQQHTVKGKVIDNLGDPLPGVNIILKGENKVGTITDIDGNYSITVPYAQATLYFSYVGFQPQEIKIEERPLINVTLVEDSKALEELVVVGYTTQKLATITGSVATITTKDLKQSPTANLNNALAGRMPGLMVNQYSGGEPGVDISDIKIRGFGTYGDSSPIVIVDGVERDMRYLAPEEIETFTILKDASATAPYGVRGANGVIIITTKRGQAQEKATVSFKASYGINKPINLSNYLGSADYATLYNEAMINSNPGVNPSTLTLFSDEAIANYRKAKGDNSDGLGYDWDYFDYAFKPGTQQDYSLSVRGGSNRARYYVMANYYNQTGNYKHTNLTQYDTQAIFQRYNFRANVDVDITDNFYTKVDLGARITDRNAPGTTAGRIVYIANTQPPYLPITLPENGNAENENYVLNNPYGLLYGDPLHRFNILGELSRTGWLNEKNTYLNGSFTLGHKLDFITKGLKIEGVFSYDAEEGRWINRVLSTRADGYATYGRYATFQPAVGNYGEYYITNANYDGAYIKGNPWYDIDETIGNGFSHNAAQSKTYYQLKLDYARSFGLHDVSGLVLFNRSSRTYDNRVEYRYQGVTGRATYAYANKYLAEFNMGYNGSENFAPGKRFGFFPAGSIGWVVTEEKFMERTNSWLNHLKLRGSYGLVGSDKISDNDGDRFAYLQFYTGGNGYNFGVDQFGNGNNGLTEGNFANPNLTWEKARKLNIGLDGALFKNQLSFAIDAFFEHRYDIITNLGGGDKLGFPDIVGKDAPFINSGIVDNRGIDFEIGWTGKIGKHFRYYIKPNFTFARNKIKFMNEISYDNEWRRNTGKRVGEHFVYEVDHFVYDQAEADKLNTMNEGKGFQPWGKLYPGDVVYKDLNGDGAIDNEHDRTFYGYPRNPEIQFGIPLGISYKGLDFSILLQGATNSSILLNGAAVYDFPDYYQDQVGKVKKWHLNRWTEATKDVATYPRLTYGANSNNKNGNSSLALWDGSYMRVKNVEIGYSLPQKMIRFAGFQNVRFYVQGLNVLTFDRLNDLDVDPEIREGSGDWYPVQRVFNFGVDITY